MAADQGLPYTEQEIRRCGDRIRKAAEREREPDPADLVLLNEYRASHQPALERCQERLVKLFHREFGMDPGAVYIGGRPLKTVEAIKAKLVRSRTRLNRMQDIAGTRIVVPTLDFQEAVSALVTLGLGDCDPTVVKDTRLHGDDYGYRAVHQVVTLEGRLAEIQIRTEAQDLWAQVVEQTDRALGLDLKHGQGPTEWLEWLIELSGCLRQRDLGNPVAIPPMPYDRLLEAQESRGEEMP